MGGPPPPAKQLAQPSVETRHQVRDALSAAEEVTAIDQPTKQELAHALVRITEAAKLLEHETGEAAPGIDPAIAEQSAVTSAPASAMNAGREFSGTAVDRMANATQNVLQAISFPRFVSELINGVFKAMVDTNQQQMQQYLELIRGVSQSLEGFSSLGGSDDAARRWIAERFPGSYAIEGEDDDEDDFASMDDDEPEPLRLITVGTAPSEDAVRAALSLEADAEVPSGGAEGLVPFVRRALAQNKQGMLATMVQMGMQRIVIDSGKITAGMRFHIDASSAAEDTQSSAFDTRHSLSAAGSVGFGPWSASASMTSTIGMVRTSDTTTTEELNASADLNSSVELNFRTDQVPLDRLASRATQTRLTQNSLNPSRETQLMLQAETARQSRLQARDTARASRQRPGTAPTSNLPAPVTVPPINQDAARTAAERAAQNRAQRQGGETTTQPARTDPPTGAAAPTGTAPTGGAAPTGATPARTPPTTTNPPNGSPVTAVP